MSYIYVIFVKMYSVNIIQKLVAKKLTTAAIIRRSPIQYVSVVGSTFSSLSVVPSVKFADL